jgi:hypothetical protein
VSWRQDDDGSFDLSLWHAYAAVPASTQAYYITCDGHSSSPALRDCSAGLDRLVRLDSRFKPFASSLLGRSSLTLKRDQMTADENTALDEVLRSFLQLLTNHFLTPAAFQVLEYLIRKYK